MWFITLRKTTLDITCPDLSGLEHIRRGIKTCINLFGKDGGSKSCNYF